jgi:hypothetical protein
MSLQEATLLVLTQVEEAGTLLVLLLDTMLVLTDHRCVTTLIVDHTF